MTPINQASNGSVETRSPPARRSFFAIALLLPVVFFALLEWALRAAGVGAYPPLFVPTPKVPGYLQPNEAVIQRFFTHPSQAPSISIDTTYFHADKPDDTLRLVVMGGSSAAGFPYGKWASPAGMLKRRLRRSFPERDIEVISTAMSAMNSYALLDFTDEIIAVAPNAVLIYAGHNEYLGVLGVGSAYSSSQSPRLTRLIQSLRRLHLYRAIETAVGNKRDPDAALRGTLMARIAGERAIDYDSPLYRKGLAQFDANMSRVLARFAQAEIPVFIATLSSNLRDQPPFDGASNTANAEAWRTLVADGQAALAAGRNGDALDALTGAVELDAGAADGWYALGQARLAADDTRGALAALRRARDLDRLRFRAAGQLNENIRRLVDAHDATLVDVADAMAAAAGVGIVGNDLMLEHLHPNERGYFVLADAFFDSLLASGLIADPARAIDDATAWDERPVTRVDALAAGYRLSVLLADWPFTDTRQRVTLPAPQTPEEQIAQAWYRNQLNWPDAMNRLMVYYQQQKDWANAARVAQNLAEAFHFLDNVQMIAGQLSGKAGNDALAASYLERAVELDGKGANQIALAQVYARLGQRQRARDALAAVAADDPLHGRAQLALRRLTAQP